MTDFEKLGAFYLGKTVSHSEDSSSNADNIVMYDSRDLTTHAVIVGMTGSGKTGLGIGLLEEALIDNIPVIAIDPKGDIANLALRFPSLSPNDFEPWVDPQQAANSGASIAEYAAKQASTWRNGLEKWGQNGDRVQLLKDSADVTIYTPGSSAGRSLSLLKSFSVPSDAVLNDAEALAEHVSSTTTGLLTLLSIDADPLSSREHVLIASILSHVWSNGNDADLPSLIAMIQAPPFNQLGVMPVDTVFPAKDRTTLAMRMNNVLASPGFQQWMQGDALRTADLLYTETGKPRASVISIAHLNDSERMFVVTSVLSDIISWMRAQQGTSSLRAVLYIDELFGYMPPVANPPSKPLLLTLLKQARAYGLGVVLSSQNPVDLDYRGLSNAGTWFIGRLQTERDKMRVMDGLEGAAQNTFNRTEADRIISGLGKRVFLMHNVHEPTPTLFETRWVLSYLAGPMTREQIRSACEATAPSSTTILEQSVSAAVTSEKAPSNSSPRSDRAPVLPPDIQQYYLNSYTAAPSASYTPLVVGVAELFFSNSRHKVSERRQVMLMAPISDGPIALDWSSSERRDDLAVSDLESSPVGGVAFPLVPRAATLPANYAAWSRQLQQWLAANENVQLFSSTSMKMVSESNESERDFRIRLQTAAREMRDAAVDKLRAKYSSRLTTAQERVRKAEQAVERESEQAKQAGLDTMISAGSAVLGAIFGRGKIGASTVGKIKTVARGANRTAQQRGDIARASENVQVIREQLAALEKELEREVELLDTAYDAQLDHLEPIVIKAKRSDVTVQLVGLVWSA